MLETAWRLIHSRPADGPTNMATDEAILAALAEGLAPPTLRFFAWEPACLSLGYAQPLADVDEARLRARGWDLVRRPTGGRAILHTDEITYTLAAPMTDPQVAGGVLESYRHLSLGLLAGLRHLGAAPEANRQAGPAAAAPNPICFETPSDYEITVAGRKLLGSAQVRKRGVVLQHGSLPLTGDLARIVDALRAQSADEQTERASLRQRVHQRAATLAEALGREVTWDEAAAALADGFRQALGLRLEPGALRPEEQAWAEQYRREKYAAPEWTGRV